jgi:predicted nuclease of predicted toxin-antitoxin system
MKFLANMGISPLTVSFLRERGHEAAHLHEQSLDRLSDSAIIEKARNENAIILTSDLDFGDLLAASKAELPSVIIFRLSPPMTADKVNAQLLAIIEKHSGDLVAGAVISVGEQRIRVRRLPIE